MRPATLAELADHYGIPMPVVSGFGSFTAFADMYVGACEVLRTDADLVRLVDEVVDDAAAAGAVWIEPAFYQPRYRDRLGPDEHILELFLDAMADAAERNGDRRRASWWPPTAPSTRPRPWPRPAWPPATPRPAWWPSAWPTTRRGGHRSRSPRPTPWPATPACSPPPTPASWPGPRACSAPSTPWVPTASSTACAPSRTRRWCSRLADEGICLDVCPTSNVLLSVVPSLEAHPLPAAARCRRALQHQRRRPAPVRPRAAGGVRAVSSRPRPSTTEALAAIAAASIESSGASPAEKAEGLAGVTAWLATTP